MKQDKKKRQLLKKAVASAAVATAIVPVYTSVVRPAIVHAATVNSGADLVRELASATPGTVITLGQGFTLTPDQIGGGNSYTIPAGVTIDGAGLTLTTRGIDLKTAGDVTLRNLNYTIVKDTSTAGSITSTNGTLTLDNVTTLIGANQSDTRPTLVAEGGNITVTGGSDQTVFDKITVKTPSTIILATNNIVSTNGVELVAGSTVTTSSKYVSKFSGPGDVVFSGVAISEVEPSNVANLTTKAGADVRLKAGLQSYGDPAIITNKITVEPGTTLNADNNILTIKELVGTGNYHMQHDGKLEVETISDPINVQIQKNDVNYEEHINKPYIQATNVNAVPIITIQNDPAQYTIKRDAGDFVLEKTDVVDKSYLKDELDIANADDENKVPTATPETKSKFEEALKKAKEVFDNPAATQPEIDAAETALREAYEGLVKDTTPATTAAPAETTAAPAETTAAPAETTAAPAETTAAPAETTAAPAETTAAPAETTAAPAETTAAPAETTAAPAETTAAPAETTAAPAETTAAPAETTAAPAETTAAPAETTAAPAETVAPTTSIVTDTTRTEVVTGTTATTIVTETPATTVVSDESSTAIVTLPTTTSIVNVTDTTSVVVITGTSSVVTEKGEGAVAVEKPVLVLPQESQGSLEPTNRQERLAHHNQAETTVVTKPVAPIAQVVKTPEGEEVLPRTSAAKKTDSQHVIFAMIGAVVAFGSAVFKKVIKK